MRLLERRLAALWAILMKRPATGIIDPTAVGTRIMAATTMVGVTTRVIETGVLTAVLPMATPTLTVTRSGTDAYACLHHVGRPLFGR